MFGDSKQYVNQGCDLTHSLIQRFRLPEWDNRLPVTTETNRRYLDEMMDAFIESSKVEARKKGAESQLFSPEYWGYVERSLIDCALRFQAGENTDDWHLQVTSCLKAWASGLNPWAMLMVADYLVMQGEKGFAKQAVKVCESFPRYWSTRPDMETHLQTTAYVMIRVYVPLYSRSGLQDVSEHRFLEKLATDIQSVRADL